MGGRERTYRHARGVLSACMYIYIYIYIYILDIPEYRAAPPTPRVQTLNPKPNTHHHTTGGRGVFFNPKPTTTPQRGAGENFGAYPEPHRGRGREGGGTGDAMGWGLGAAPYTCAECNTSKQPLRQLHITLGIKLRDQTTLTIPEVFKLLDLHAHAHKTQGSLTCAHTLAQFRGTSSPS